MAEQNIKTRIVMKHDTEANWDKASNFIPKKGEIIIYDADAVYSYSRMKIGDGARSAAALPFIDEELWSQFSEMGSFCVTDDTDGNVVMGFGALPSATEVEY